DTLSSTEEALAATKDTLASTEKALAATKDTLSSTEEELVATKETLSSTEAELTAAKDTITSTAAELSTTKDTLTSTEAALSETADTLSLTQATLEDAQTQLADANQQLEELVISPDSDNYKVEYVAGRQFEGLPTDVTRTRVKIDFSNYGMYVNNVKLEILNPDKEVIYSTTVRPGEMRYIVSVSEPIVPGEFYWIRRTYYDGSNNEISTLLIQVEAYLGM
ncbi:MAG: hypothetical protein II920_02550, partial [Clostridia bacterium]|nr:hypothetical protein [Clostridia bacterium]